MPAGLFQTLEAERAALVAEGNSIRATAEAAGGYTDEQRERDDQIAERLEIVTADLGRLGRQREADRQAPATPAAAETTGAPTPSPKPFASLGQQLQAVFAAATQKHKPLNPGLEALNNWWSAEAAASGANELVGADGGFVVQTDFQDDLMNLVMGQSELADRTTPREVGPNANGVKFNQIDQTSRADGSRFGGVRAYWTGEAGALTASRPKMAQQEITLQKLTGLYYATDEELADGVALQSGVEEMFPAEFGFKLDDAIVRGTGAGMPLGYLNSNCLVTVNKETGQAASTVLKENIDKMYARLWAPSMKNAIWAINQEIYPQLFSLGQTVGVGGVPVFLPAGNSIANAPFGTIYGRPIVPVEQASALGAVGDISLIDLSQYVLLRKGGIQQAASIHVLFSTDETAFRWVLRINGRPKWLSALTPFKGSSTLSPFVTLQAR